MDETRFQDVRMISAAGAEESLALRRMAEEAERYVSGFPWAPPMLRGWLADGAGGIIAVCLFEFTKPITSGDRKLWVIVGDFPRACVAVLPDDRPRAAVERYAAMLDRWIDGVMSFQPAERAEYPLELERSLPEAKVLRMKLDFLRSEILPFLE